MTLKEYQDILYEILCVVDDICRKNRIPYMLYGGTMLGAVRHKDFIPWDDDVDILIWWKDYKRFRSRLKEELPPHLKLVEPIDMAPYFHDQTIRVSDMRYYMHEPDKEDRFYGNKQNHICVDIFQLVYSGNTVLESRITGLLYKILWGLAMGHRYQVKNENYTFLERMQAAVLSIVGARCSVEKIIRWMQKLIERQSRKKKRYCMAVNSSPIGLDWIYESKWYRNVVYQPFRERKLPIPKEYDKHLTMQYGNYMQPVRDWDTYIQHFK